MNPYQSYSKKKVWRRKGIALIDPKHSSSSVKHGGGAVMGWACVTAKSTDTLVFIDDGTAGSNCTMNC